MDHAIEYIHRRLRGIAQDVKHAGLDWRWLEKACTEAAIEQGLRKRRVETKGEGLERFNEFWEAYPTEGGRRTNKPGCARKWAAAGLDAEANAILLGLARLKVTESWMKDGGKYVPMAQTFLNQRRWDDVTQDADVFGLEGAL
jgi:hypothetical protein